jgi:AraC-like DNA-binding protein/mannose-6-phosphate isomerase-like protein (cupin superfamily)
MVERSGRRPPASVSRINVPKESCQDHFSVVEPQINAQGVHRWPFDMACPVDVAFLTGNDRHRIRMNRHEYFELSYLCSGSADYHIQDRLLRMSEGDLAVVGSTVYHRIEWRSSSPVTIVGLFFEPDMIRCDGASDGAEYLTPFFLQDSQFPHVVPARTGVPRQVLDMMLRIHSELPASSPRARLTVKTYLKMALMLLVNQYASYAGTVETFRRQQDALDRLLPLFRHLGENCGDPIQVSEAAHICGMSASHFMSFFKHVTGLPFMKYLNNYRIERAQTLLANTDESMASISQQIGFCDQSYFGMVFRRTLGMTPAAYRRRARETNSGHALASPSIAHDLHAKLSLLATPPRYPADLHAPAIPMRKAGLA